MYANLYVRLNQPIQVFPMPIISYHVRNMSPAIQISMLENILANQLGYNVAIGYHYLNEPTMTFLRRDLNLGVYGFRDLNRNTVLHVYRIDGPIPALLPFQPITIMPMSLLLPETVALGRPLPSQEGRKRRRSSSKKRKGSKYIKR